MKYSRLLSLLLAVVVISIPDLVLAALVTCSGGNECNTCHFVSMVNGIINWLIGILFIVFSIVMVVAGFGLVTSGGNQSALDNAKKKFQNGIIGIILVLAAYLIVDTLLRGILSGGNGTINGYGPWSEVKCAIQEATVMYVETSPEPADAVGNEPVNGTPGTTLTHAEALDKLKAAGVDVKNGADLKNIKSSTIDGVIALSKSCGCKIVVTEGTGGTHSGGTYSHANGYKLDLRSRDNPTLVNYIKNNYKPAGTWSDGTPLYTNGNATYALESDHIDVVYKP